MRCTSCITTRCVRRLTCPADIAILTFAQVASCYKRDKSKQVSFRPLAAIPYRKGAFRYKGLEHLNIKTADGRRHDIPMVMGDYKPTNLAMSSCLLNWCVVRTVSGSSWLRLSMNPSRRVIPMISLVLTSASKTLPPTPTRASYRRGGRGRPG